MEYTAPAKVNLYLKILERREDGYHRIETLFERIAICDIISIEKSGTPLKITCDDPRVPVDAQGLIGKTVLAFSSRTGNSGFEINIKKEIPIGAGLGGGSSDAAAVLLGMNDICGKPLDKEELSALGREMGADVPFFLENCSFAVGEERGDIVKKVETDTMMWHVLVNPPIEVPTKEIYEAVDPLNLTENKGIDKMISAFLTKSGIRNIAENLHNDLQSIALQKFSIIKNILIEVQKTEPEGVLMSGSGPTVFGLFDGERRASEAQKKLEAIFPTEEGWKVLLAGTY